MFLFPLPLVDFLYGAWSVSYTHLDVYKRQELFREDIGGHKNQRLYLSGAGDHGGDVGADLTGTVYPSGRQDVYKRQVQGDHL